MIFLVKKQIGVLLGNLHWGWDEACLTKILVIRKVEREDVWLILAPLRAPGTAVSGGMDG